MEIDLRKIFEEKMFNLYQDEYSLMGEYKNAKSPVQLRHNICGCEFTTKPTYFTRGTQKCPSDTCKHKRIMEKNSKNFHNKLGKQNLFEAVGIYDGIDSPMDYRCKQCDTIFTLQKAGKIFEPTVLSHCPNCYEKIYYSQKDAEYKAKIQDFFNGEFEVYGTYSGCDEQISLLHKKCGYISIYDRAGRIFTDYLCPCKYCNISKGEKAIMNVLDKYHCPYISQKEFDNLLGVGYGNLSYDFYLPQYNLLIEYQGSFHDGTADLQTSEQFEIQQEHDRRKREYAELHGIKLLEIWYWDFDNIEEIIQNKLNEIISKKEIA